MTKDITRSEHTRRQFLRAVALTGAGASLAAAGLSRAVAEVDVFEVRLDAYSAKVVKFTTPWGQLVDDWHPAFLAAHDDLAAHGGGRLVVPGGDATTERKYYISKAVNFDLPSISVHLNEFSYVERVGPPDIWRGAPLCFHGHLDPDPAKRRQQDYAALFGPGKVGYPQAHLARYPHENGVGMSYYRSAYVDRVQVPFAPGKGLTAQFGCNLVSFTNNKIGPTAQSADEQNWAGQAAITVQGGFNPPSYPLFTDVAVKWNTVGQSVRAVYVDFAENVEIGGNTFAPLARTGLTVAACTNAIIRDNTIAQASRGAFGGYNGIEIVGVDNPDLLRNTLQNTSHNHCVYSAYRQGRGGAIYARGNRWTKGSGTIFAGSPAWDSD